MTSTKEQDLTQDHPHDNYSFEQTKTEISTTIMKQLNAKNINIDEIRHLINMSEQQTQSVINGENYNINELLTLANALGLKLKLEQENTSKSIVKRITLSQEQVEALEELEITCTFYKLTVFLNTKSEHLGYEFPDNIKELRRDFSKEDLIQIIFYGFDVEPSNL